MARKAKKCKFGVVKIGKRKGQCLKAKRRPKKAKRAPSARSIPSYVAPPSYIRSAGSKRSGSKKSSKPKSRGAYSIMRSQMAPYPDYPGM